ncbi:protease inhibitor I42 family protein [Streptomyces sp. NPDC046821]|uniref:protease inhibitor I42 family protein n=1 Tax=Streptomyces sp. NPDC046821 TaxID=3154702 RepID=UPI0033F48C66
MPISTPSTSSRAEPVLRTALVCAAGLALLSGCGGGPESFGAGGSRNVTVGKGDTFTLEVPANPALGQNWYLAGPRPDRGVVTYKGKREEYEGGGEDLIGSGDGTQFFDFRARAAGTTTVKLVFCPRGMCRSAAEVSASPVPTATTTAAPTDADDEIAYYVYTVTVT